MAKDIATDGYLLNEEPIVCKEGESYVVLEGNLLCGDIRTKEC